MNCKIYVLRRERGSQESYWETYDYTSRTDNDTVATALTRLNEAGARDDSSGHAARPIEWECSCMQRKCGACAMVINGRPRLACDTKLAEAAGGVVRVEPLRKFPVVCDLMVDRSILFDNLKTLKLWLRSDAQLADRDQELAYESSECIQCGCCLEVCPNFYAGGRFFGMSAVPVTTRLLTEMDAGERRELTKLYTEHIYDGCGKSLACQDICPKHIETEKLMVNANAFAIWKRKRFKKK